MKCRNRNCGTEIADNALICYRCGTATTELRVKPPEDGPIFARKRRSPVSIIVLLLLALLALLASLDFANIVDLGLL